MKKILLLSMPFGALERPALGLSLLKSELAILNVDCEVRYLDFTFAELIAYEEYQWMSFDLPYTAFAGDWSFTSALYGENLESDAGYIEDVLRGNWRLDETSISRILHVRSLTQYYLDYCMTTVQWDEYSIVGFTSTFEQNIASLALAKRIRAAHPEITLVFGGANWEGEMGLELHRQFPFVDFVCSGEADDSFPELVQGLMDMKPLDPYAIPGLVFREHGESISSGQAHLVSDLDRRPFPDFSDYFHDLDMSSVASLVVPILLLETSRGCWWGQKSHCTFCGLNGGTMTFRSKTAKRVIDELKYLIGEWQLDFVEVVDNILDMKYFNTVLPALAEMEHDALLFYEVKANLKRKHVDILNRAGVTKIQPGIESMSDHVLKLMRKGTTALRNIQLLKWCKEYEVIADWNILYGFPGETQEDYDAMLALLPSIRFLGAPTGCGPIRLDRFSPYHGFPEEFGMVNVRPALPYKYLYPFAEEVLNRIAYYFDYDYVADVDPTGIADRVVEYVLEWQRQPELGTLFSVERADGALVLGDTRADAVRKEHVLTGWQRAIYEFCDEIQTPQTIIRDLRDSFSEEIVDETELIAFLDSLVSNRHMVTDGSYYLSLAIPTPSPQKADLIAPLLADQRIQSSVPMS